jgi:hypothetical protein
MSETNETNDLATSGDEFAGLQPAPPRRSPILALSMIGLSAFTIFHARNDIRYALSPHQPVPFTEAKDENLGAGRYVSVSGMPGRRDSLYVESRGDKGRESFFRLIDVEPPVFVRAKDTADRVQLSATWKGRLQHFSDVSWAAGLRDYFAHASQKLSRSIDLGSLKAKGALVDRRGRALSLPSDTQVEIVYKPSEYALYLSREKIPTKDDAKHELDRVLAQRPGTPAPTAGEDTTDSFVFYLPLEKDTTKQNELMALFERAAKTSSPIDIEAHARTVKMPLAALKVENWDDVAEARVEEPLTVDAGTLVLTEGESPQGFLWAPLTAALLLLLAAWNLWYLGRPRRV